MSNPTKQHRGIARTGYTECTDNDCWCHDPAHNPQNEMHVKKAFINQKNAILCRIEFERWCRRRRIYPVIYDTRGYLWAAWQSAWSHGRRI